MSSIFKGLNEAFDVAAMQQEYRTRKAEILQNAEAYSEKYGIPVDDKYFAEKVMSKQEHESNVAKSNAARDKANQQYQASQAQQLEQDKQNIGQLKAQLAQLEKSFDPNYQYSDDHTFWSQQSSIASQISALKKRISNVEGQQLDELSPQTLASYKKKAGADASAADKAGDIQRANKRFSGIVKATKKEFDKDVNESELNELINQLSESEKQSIVDQLKESLIEGTMGSTTSSPAGSNASAGQRFYKPRHVPNQDELQKQGVAEGYTPSNPFNVNDFKRHMDTVVDKVMGRAPTNKYHVGQIVKYEMDPPQEGGSGVGKITRVNKVGDHYEIDGSKVVNHYEIKGVEQGVAEESEKNPFTNALGRALYRDLSKEKKASPAQVQRNKERWAQRQAEQNKEQPVKESNIMKGLK